jgi:outer membrane protein assembly factor BamD (BamD/ComL family)
MSGERSSGRAPEEVVLEAAARVARADTEAGLSPERSRVVLARVEAALAAPPRPAWPRWLALSLVPLAATAGVLLWLRAAPERPPPSLEPAAVAELRHASGPIVSRLEPSLRLGEVVLTAGERVDLALPAGRAVLLGPARAALAEDGLLLEQGRVLLEVSPRTPRQPTFVLRAGEDEVRVLGAVLEVARVAGRALAVTVVAGEAEVRRDGRTTSLRAGQGLGESADIEPADRPVLAEAPADALSAPWWRTGPDATAYLVVDGPAGAEVHLDGRGVGVAPLVVAWPAGSVVVERRWAEGAGKRPAEGVARRPAEGAAKRVDVDLRAGATAHVADEAPGAASVRGVPAGVDDPETSAPAVALALAEERGASASPAPTASPAAAVAPVRAEAPGKAASPAPVAADVAARRATPRPSPTARALAPSASPTDVAGTGPVAASPAAASPSSEPPGLARRASPSSSPSPSAPTLAEARVLLEARRCAPLDELLVRLVAAERERAAQASAELLGAECWLRRGDRARAAERYAQLVARYPETSSAEPAQLEVAKLAEARGQSVAALEAVELYLARYPSGRFGEVARLMRCELLVGGGRLAEGRACVTDFQARYPEAVRAHAARVLSADLARLGGRLPEAVAGYRRYLAEAPRGEATERVHYHLCESLRLLGDPSARAAMAEFLRLHPRSARADDVRRWYAETP